MPLVGRESQKLVIQKFEKELNTAIYDLYQQDLYLSAVQDEYLQLPRNLNYLSMSKCPYFMIHTTIELLMVKLGCCSE